MVARYAARLLIFSHRRIKGISTTGGGAPLIKSCYDSLVMTNRHYRYQFIAFLLLSAVSFGCSDSKANKDITICTDPRPEICTMDYTPVCGLRNVSGKEEWKTYSNACSACSDPSATGYKKDACEVIGK